MADGAAILAQEAVGPYRVVLGGPGPDEVPPDDGSGLRWVHRGPGRGDPVLTATTDPRGLVLIGAGEDDETAVLRAAGAPLLAWLAADAADVCVMGRLSGLADGGCRLAVVSAAVQASVDGAEPVCLRGSMVFHGDRGWSALRELGVVQPDGSELELASLPEPSRLVALTAAGLSSLEEHARRRGAAQLDQALAERVRTAEREALAGLAKTAGTLSSSAAELQPWSEALRLIQERCLALYGRLEPERALTWALEELGELAQAVRRGESTVRIEEELGQLTAWCFCLANIGRVDLAHAFSKAFTEERDRQLGKYGAIRPYRARGGTG